jgi:hypothetical protein
MRARHSNGSSGNSGNKGFNGGGLSQGGLRQGEVGRRGSDGHPGDGERGITNLNLHTGKCSVCGHPQREDIERDFMAWRSPKEIVKEYKLGNRRPLYRHAHAFGLMERRYVDLRAALGRIIERAGEVPVTAWAVVAAVRACAKINARGQWMERGESNQMRELLDAMNHDELLAYAERGTFPSWFRGTGVAAKEIPGSEPDGPEGADG